MFARPTCPRCLRDCRLFIVVRVTERAISRSLEGSHEDGLQNVFDGEVTNVAHGAVEFGERGEMMVDSALGPSQRIMRAISRASRTVCMCLWSSWKSVRRTSHTFWAHIGWAGISAGYEP